MLSHFDKQHWRAALMTMLRVSPDYETVTANFGKTSVSDNIERNVMLESCQFPKTCLQKMLRRQVLRTIQHNNSIGCLNAVKADCGQRIKHDDVPCLD